MLIEGTTTFYGNYYLKKILYLLLQKSLSQIKLLLTSVRRAISKWFLGL